MTTNTNAAEQKKESGNPFDIFIVGLRKGLKSVSTACFPTS